MKTNKISLAAGIAYTFLIYQEGIGVNILLLNIILIGLQCWIHPQKMLLKSNLIFSAAALLSSTAALLHGHFLSILANITALLMLSINLVVENQNLISNLLHALYAWISTPFIKFIAMFNKTAQQTNQDEIPTEKNINYKFAGIFSALIFIIFFAIYRNMSAGFDQFIKNLNTEFISLPLIIHYLFGVFLLSTFFKPYILNKLAQSESKLGNYLAKSAYKSYAILGIAITETTEQFMAKIIFFGLNLLLLLVNLIDTYHLSNQIMPQGLSYSEYVHQGVDALIWSIILAVSIILWVFRGSQNFNQNSHTKTLSYIWIALNVWLILTAAYRNYLYIHETELYTYKRIGVYFFLACSIIGLFLTFYKIQYQRSNYFLVRTNSFIWYTLLIGASTINWDKHIAQHHINYSLQTNKIADTKYLYKLSYSAYPALASYWYETNKSSGESAEMCRLEAQIFYHVLSDEKKNYSWKSYNLADSQTFTQLQNLCFK
ncbi:MAG: DUF4173 domain-containing protein [Bacteroidota bacterium]|nr:DUF4173 domain-containing protein [Bacteroidota bacterium]